MPEVTNVAWVESPLQLLGVLEAIYANLFSADTLVEHRKGVVSVGDFVDVIVPPPGVTFRPRLYPRHQLGQLWITGDAFSGVVQTAVLQRGLRPMVIVDDGLATAHLLRTLQNPALPLIRPQSNPSRFRGTLGMQAAQHLRRLAGQGQLTVFTALPLTPAEKTAAKNLGLLVQQHSFGWSRTQTAVDAPAGTVIVGSALAHDGFIKTSAYIDWIAQIAADQPTIYIPHRRELPQFIRTLEHIAQLSVSPGIWPVEVRLQGLGPGDRVHVLPSTPWVTLPIMLKETGAAVIRHPIDPDWWTATATAQFQHHLYRSTVEDFDL